MHVKTFTKIFAVLLVIIMMLSVTACGTGSTQDNSQTKTDAVQTQTTATDAGSESATLEEPTKLTLFVDETWWFYDKWEGAIPEEFNKQANVEIEVTRAADDKQLPLMVASGNMTDLVDTGRYQYMANADTSLALDTLHTQYSDVNFPVHSVRQFVNKMSDGHYYTIGCGFSPESEYKGYNVGSEGTGFLYREDIAQKLGITINTLADLDTAFAKVKEQDPGVTPIVFNYIHQFGWLRNMMGLPVSGYYDDNGSLVWYISAKGQLDYYKKVNEWYRKGYISPDNFAYQTEDDTQKVAVSGKAFSVFAYDNHADMFNTTIKSNGETFQFKQLSDIISDKAKRYDNNAGWRGLYITKSCKNVEAAYKSVAYAYSDKGMRLLMWGIEGEDYTLNDKGYPAFKYNFQGDNSVLQPRGLKYWGWLVHNAIVTGIADATSDSQTAKARNAFSNYVVHNPVIGLIRFETDSDEQVISTKLTDMIKTEEVKIYMAESEAACEQAYSDMLKKAESIGMSKLVTYGNEKYTLLKPEYDKIAQNEN
jgi:putative aldouronate transport system substrate-binding protein